ncbi:MAG: metallophosphoesterase family protein [Fimbriimonas sp.]
MESKTRLSRRDILAASAGGVLLTSLGAAAPSPARKRSLRVAHLTDIHVQPTNGAPEGMEKCLVHAQSQRTKPDLILTGGDLIMDALAVPKDHVQKQWDIFNRVLKANVKTPIRHAIGNHDVWGWGDRAKFASEPKFGKKWACEELGLAKPYYSFDQGGWHFVVLDSNHATEGDGYKARLDDEQFEWLKGDLAATPAKRPVLVLSHIPIIGVCSMFDGENEKAGEWRIPASYVHVDSRRIKDLFLKHKNVKLCVSGHEHQYDQVVYNDVTYFCNGAVCGGWWGGNHFECTYGYGLIDLFDDGTFENRYVPYGWKTVK